MATFNVWATLLTKESLDQLVSALLDKGCSVSPLAGAGKLGITGETACLLAVQINASWKNTVSSKQKIKLLESIKDGCKDLGLHYFSIVVTDISDGGSTWAGEAPAGRRL